MNKFETLWEFSCLRCRSENSQLFCGRENDQWCVVCCGQRQWPMLFRMLWTGWARWFWGRRSMSKKEKQGCGGNKSSSNFVSLLLVHWCTRTTATMTIITTTTTTTTMTMTGRRRRQQRLSVVRWRRPLPFQTPSLLCVWVNWNRLEPLAHTKELWNSFHDRFSEFQDLSSDFQIFVSN